ncbi:low molecular weight phosphotyrosine protein phosphatase-like [Mytilus californianus]|uniref:Low molecular weight phosphotyrosine protein phosphatase n=1 Tax=Mytilus coruscus TaxID=42192 RepID=A0A6J8AP39_MYTCO|nr:low molecular weight phosphotyrosine protein phosphatase-like [Mytilus californianus]CAC5369770.1 ACP1 [Mytilus coruscus]
MSKKHSVLFICLGNICRSPIAEAVFLRLLKEKKQEQNWDVDSAAMGDWHLGLGPNERTVVTLKKFGITDYKHIVRQIKPQDFERFDYIFGMDHQNMSDLEGIKPKNCHAKTVLLGEYDPQKELIIVDPYFGNDMKDFDKVYEQCCRCCEGFFNAVTGS